MVLPCDFDLHRIVKEIVKERPGTLSSGPGTRVVIRTDCCAMSKKKMTRKKISRAMSLYVSGGTAPLHDFIKHKLSDPFNSFIRCNEKNE